MDEHCCEGAGEAVKPKIISVLLSFVLAGVSMAAGMGAFGGGEQAFYISGASAFAVVLLFGRHFLLSIHRVFYGANMNTLVGLGVLASFGLSIYNVHFLHRQDYFFDSAAFICAFVLFGQFLERTIQFRMDQKMSALADFLPQKARKLDGENEIEVSPASLQVGDEIRVRAGERVAVDARLLGAGPFSFDESLLSGESRPVERSEGEVVPQGAVCIDQAVDLRVHQVSSQSVYEQLVKYTRESLSQRPAVQQKIDRIASIFVPIVVLLSIGVGYFWFRRDPESTFFVQTSVSVLVIACPCAMGMATPTALFVGAIRAARQGFLLKSLDAVEKAADITKVAFDKTGTLTKGQPEVTKLKAGENIAHKDILKLAVSAESRSEHPYAEAIRKKAAAEGVEASAVENLENIPGMGVKGTVKIGNKVQEVIVGQLRLLYENGYDSTAVPESFLWEVEGSKETALWVGVDHTYMRLIFVGDQLRPEASETVRALQSGKYEVGLITGDTEQIAAAIAKKLDLKFYHSEVLPREKAAIVRRLSEPKKKGLDMVYPKVAFVGDGINDAPALAEAHLGVAMGSGTSLAQTTSDIVLVSNNLKKIGEVFDSLKATRGLIQQNLLLSFGYNIIAIPIAAGVLVPWLGISLDPKIAAAAMALSSVSVMLNSARKLIG